MSTEKKCNVFDVLKSLNDKDYDMYDSLTAEQIKGFAPFVVQRWATGCNDPNQITLLNEFVNPYVFTLQQDKKLMWLLMTACSSGVNHRYKWVKPKGSNRSRPETTKIISTYFGYSMAEAEDCIVLLNKDLVVEYAYQLGVDDATLRLIEKEWKPTETT